MITRSVLSALLLSSVAAASAFAQDAPESSASPPAAASSQASVPKLHIVWDCGECEHNDKVPPLIEQAYAEEAQKHSVAVSETEIAEATITDIRQRPPGVRVMFGVMAGRDRLALRIVYRDRDHEVKDTSSNIIQGLNSLSASVGRKAYARLSEKPAP